jgi:GH15 family glucan-1,4-alpha-glucosidase
MPLLIEDYVVIGDCETAALIGRDGSIDWLCWPRFDSDACFAALLGGPEHGRWLIAPANATMRVDRRYRGDTLILETRFETADGVVLVVDLMPPRTGHSDLVRFIIGEHGKVAMRMELVLRFGYGDLVPWVHRQEDGTLRAIAGPDQAVLRTHVSVQGEGPKTVGDFIVGEGEIASFTLLMPLLTSCHPIPPIRTRLSMRRNASGPNGLRRRGLMRGNDAAQ